MMGHCWGTGKTSKVKRGRKKDTVRTQVLPVPVASASRRSTLAVPCKRLLAATFSRGFTRSTTVTVTTRGRALQALASRDFLTRLHSRRAVLLMHESPKDQSAQRTRECSLQVSAVA